MTRVPGSEERDERRRGALATRELPSDHRRPEPSRGALTDAPDAAAEPIRLNDFNPYSFDAEGWCVPTESRVQAYDRQGPPVDSRAQRPGSRSVLAHHIAVLRGQPRRAVAWEVLWARWQNHPRRGLVEALFPTATTPALQRSAHEEVAAFRVRTVLDERFTPVVERLYESGLSTANASRIVDLLVMLRHAWTSRSSDAADAGYDDVNWRHACGEVAQVVEIAAAASLGDDITCDAALASLLSDCAKLRGNFLTHHIDGALAAFLLLPKVLPATTPRERQRIVAICQAIVEHQVGPPRFMASMVRMGIQSMLQKVGATVDDATAEVLDGLYARIADPMNPEHVERSSEGVGCLRLSRDERSLLKLIDLTDWYVPHPQTPWFEASSAVIDADSLVNYVTADGVGKIVAICGPGTPFRDPTVFHSVFSCGASFVDAVSLMSDVAMGAVTHGLAMTRTLIDEVRSRIALELARGVLVFPLSAFDRVVVEEGVDLSALRVRRMFGLAVVCLTVPPESLPYWSVPLDPNVPGVHRETARLLRRKMADLLRAV